MFKKMDYNLLPFYRRQNDEKNTTIHSDITADVDLCIFRQVERVAHDAKI